MCMQKFLSLTTSRHNEVLEYVFFLNTSQKVAVERKILTIEVFLLMTVTDCCKCCREDNPSSYQFNGYVKQYSCLQL